MKTDDLGRCYWVTGLCGSGKTTIGKLLYNHFKKVDKNIVYLDGDILREVLDSTEEYSPSERLKLALSYSRLCRMLTLQGLNVVCATISMFNEVRAWNRENIENYYEIYIKVSYETLLKRDQKKLYTKALNGEKNIVGMDLEYDEPKNPDVILENNGTHEPEKLLNVLLSKIL